MSKESDGFYVIQNLITEQKKMWEKVRENCSDLEEHEEFLEVTENIEELDRAQEVMNRSRKALDTVMMLTSVCRGNSTQERYDSQDENTMAMRGFAHGEVSAYMKILRMLVGP